MAAALDFTIAKKHVVSILQASRTAYAATTDGSKRALASDDEIYDTILEVDGEVCTAIVQTVGHPYSGSLLSTSVAIQHGGLLPTSVGTIHGVSVSEDNITYTGGKEAASEQDIHDMRNNPTRYGGATATLGWFKITGNVVWTTSAYVKVYYTDYTKTSAPQAPQSYMSAVVAGSVARLLKDGGDMETSVYYGQMYQGFIAQIKALANELPIITRYGANGG